MNQAESVSHNEQTYINVMESLVTEEVRKQLQNVPTKIRRYLKLEEMVTYALNRLPALYASSEKGVKYQRQIAERDMSRQIKNAVHQAIMAVQVDPIRLSKPITTNHNQEAEAVLKALQTFFQTPDLNWSTALGKLSELKKNPLGLEQVTAQNSRAWRPGNQRSRVAWTHRRPRPVEQSDEPNTTEHDKDAVGWDNVLYRL